MKVLDRLGELTNLSQLRLDQDCPTAWAAMDDEAARRSSDSSPEDMPGLAFGNAFDNWRDSW